MPEKLLVVDEAAGIVTTVAVLSQDMVRPAAVTLTGTLKLPTAKNFPSIGEPDVPQ